MTAEAPGRLLGGFSAYGDSARGVLETLAGIDGAWFAADGDAIVMRSGAGTAAAVADAGVGVGPGGVRRTRRLAEAQSAPVRLAVAHYDPARDYQAGLQRALRPGAGGREERIELPAALDAGAAKAVAEGMLARAQARRERRTVALGMAGLGIGPGERVTIAGEAGLWRVARWTLEQMVVRLELERIARGPMTVAASAGRVSGAPDLVHGPTILHAFEIPPVDDAVLDRAAADDRGGGRTGVAAGRAADLDRRWRALDAARGRRWRRR